MAAKELAKFGRKENEEVYVTSSYKAMLKENEVFEAKDNEIEKYNEKHGAAGKDNLSAFSRNLYAPNIF